MATGTLGSQARDYPARSFQLVSTIGTGGQAFVAGGSVGFKLGTIPAGAGILRASTVIGTVFNGTTPTVGLGTTSAGVNLSALAGGPITTLGANSITLTAAAVQYATADTDIYVTWGSGAGNNAGQGLVCVEYAVAGGQ